jgi:hypothetical protein
MRKTRQKIKKMDRIELYTWAIILMVVIFAIAAIIAAVALTSVGGGEVKEAKTIKWLPTLKNTGIPLLDSDRDGLGDIEENYKYGTDPFNPDTDGDGMPDGYEVRFGYQHRDPRTGHLLLDPNDPTDAYSDPDNDGYDFNHNGYVDGSEQDKNYAGSDWVYLSKLKVAAQTDYTTYNLNQLLSNLREHQGELVRVADARVVDNGSYQDFGTQMDRQINISITDPSTNMELPVLLDVGCNRPINLFSDNSTLANPPHTADIVDVQGIFVGSELDYRIVCRGTEKFTNIMEYLSAKPSGGNGTMNYTDPLNWDTDGDGMADGWEAHYGQGFMNTSVSPPVWEWITPIDPTWPDALLNLDGYMIQVPDPTTGEQKWVGYIRDKYLAIVNPELELLVPPSQRNLADMLGRDDIPRGWYAYGMNPSMPDTDLDSFDIDNGGSNTNDMMEVFYFHTDPTNRDTDGDTMADGWEIHYALNATWAGDKYDDPDNDGLQNYQEFMQQARTNPHRWDTDDEGERCKNPTAIFDDPNDPACFDGMPDGWEVIYGLNPLDPSDQYKDSDVIDIAGVPVARPDGLLNLFEYRNGTDPTNPDTDGDHLSDYEEVTIGWDVKVNSKMEHYYTCATAMDTDHDTVLGPVLPDGSSPGPAGTEFLNPGDPDTVHDMNDWNEIVYYHTNASNPDTDGDGLNDPVELFTNREPDLPGFHGTDPTLTDTDGDNLNDYVEVVGTKIWLPDSAVQQVIRTNPLRLDSDNDGLTDGDEVIHDYNPKDVSGKTQSYIKLVQDTDGYFMPAYEPDIGKRVDSCNPTNPDTNHNGLPDGYEFEYSDPDADGLPTWWEIQYGAGHLDPWKQDTDNNGIPDMMEDFDADGLNNLEEFRHRTDPWNPDSAIPGLEHPPGLPNAKSRAFNGVKDSDEGGLGKDKSQPFRDQWGHPIMLRQPVYSDSDGDAMPDWWEIIHHLNPHANDARDDKDADGFANLDEYIYGTDPEVADTNGNGIPDWKDHVFAYNPMSVDTDGNQIADWWERYFFGGVCDPNYNPTGGWNADAGVYGDNWTNLQHWHVQIDGWPEFKMTCNPLVNDSNGNGINDDVDPYPTQIPYIGVLGLSPMNPTDIKSLPMNPIKTGGENGDTDRDGMTNLEEYQYPFGTLDPTDPDSNQDGLPDGWEVAQGRPLWNFTFGNDTGVGNGTPVRILDPLGGADQILQDPDIDGVNYSLKWVDLNHNKWPDSGEFTITETDFGGKGYIDPFFDNESFSNWKEYAFGKDANADGINENTTYPWNNDTFKTGMLDGYTIGFDESDGDMLPNIWEMKYGLGPLDPAGINGSDGDPDGDGYTNLQEYQNHTDPRDPQWYPGHTPFGRSNGAPDPNNMPADYEVAQLIEQRLMQSPHPYYGPLLQNVQAYLWNYRKDF